MCVMCWRRALLFGSRAVVLCRPRAPPPAPRLLRQVPEVGAAQHAVRPPLHAQHRRAHAPDGAAHLRPGKKPRGHLPPAPGGPLWAGLGPPEAITALCPPVPSQVSAYGFITANYEQFSDHYYEVEKKPLVFYANHDMLLEAELWRSLHQAGIMELYQR